MYGLEANIPTDYQKNNELYNIIYPNTVHCKNTVLTGNFRRFLLQDLFSIFKWKLPKTWDKDYFLYNLFCYGYNIIINTEKYGIIPQWGTLGGYNVFYRPAYALVTNPLLPSIRAELGENATIIKIAPDYMGLMDLVNRYADMLALIWEAAGIDLNNVKLGTIFFADNKAQAEAYKKAFDQLASGNPAVVMDKKLLREDGTNPWTPFTQNVKNTYIVTDLLSDMRKVRDLFNTEVGIPNANTYKKERMITDEVNANNVETRCKIELWYDNIHMGIDETKTMFPDIDISCEYRFDTPEMNKEAEE